MSKKIKDNEFTTTSMDNEGIDEFICPVCDEFWEDCTCEQEDGEE